MDKEVLLKKTLELAEVNTKDGGWPFSTLIIRDGEIVAEAANGVHKSNDPTDHAEVAAIRLASEKLGTPNLSDCEIYMVAPPCPMCMGAIILAGIKTIHCVLDLEQKDELLTNLPLSLSLYEKVQGSLDGEFPKLEINSEFVDVASNTLKNWNNSIDNHD